MMTTTIDIAECMKIWIWGDISSQVKTVSVSHRVVRRPSGMTTKIIEWWPTDDHCRCLLVNIICVHLPSKTTIESWWGRMWSGSYSPLPGWCPVLWLLTSCVHQSLEAILVLFARWFSLWQTLQLVDGLIIILTRLLFTDYDYLIHYLSNCPVVFLKLVNLVVLMKSILITFDCVSRIVE